MKNKLKLLIAGAILGLTGATARAATITYVPITTNLSASATGYNQSGTSLYFQVKGATTAVFSSAGTSVLGTTTNDSASTGYVGEYISTVTANYKPAIGTGSGNDLVNFTLTAGDWDISLCVDFQANGATVTSNDAWVGTTSGNNANGRTIGDTDAQSVGPTASTNVTVCVPNVRKSISGSTTYYLKTITNYSGGPPSAYGRMSARRVR